MDHLEQDDSMPAFIKDVKAYSNLQNEYHYQHSAAIRKLEDKINELNLRIAQIENYVNNVKNKS